MGFLSSIGKGLMLPMTFGMDQLGGLIGDITGTNAAADAAQQAGYIQAGSAQAGIDEQKRQFDKIVELLSPFVSAGTGAVSQQNILAGGGTPEEYQQSIDQILASPQYQVMEEKAREGILQNASATGGLRGGNIEETLMRYQPEILANLINQQYGMLGGLSSLGQASAANQAAAGQNTAGNIANLLGQKGAAIAGGELAQGALPMQNFKTLLQGGSMAAGLF